MNPATSVPGIKLDEVYGIIIKSEITRENFLLHMGLTKTFGSLKLMFYNSTNSNLKIRVCGLFSSFLSSIHYVLFGIISLLLFRRSCVLLGPQTYSSNNNELVTTTNLSNKIEKVQRRPVHFVTSDYLTLNLAP